MNTSEQDQALAEVAKVQKAAANDPLFRERATWDESPALRDEFKTFESYCAFTQAAAAGRVKIVGQKTVHA